MSVHLIYLIDLSDYQRHFMCWQFVAVGLGLVLDTLDCDLIRSIDWLDEFIFEHQTYMYLVILILKY